MSKHNYDINDALLIKYLLGETTTEEELMIKQWIQSSDNEKYFQQMKNIWEEAGTLYQKSTVNVDDAWKKFQQRIQQQPASSGKLISIHWRRWYSIAAAVLLVAITAALWMNTSTINNQFARVESGNKILVDTLVEGSIITLNQYASLEYDRSLSGAERVIKLKGEAFFNVTPDKSKPFVVSTGNALIKVIGTSFNIKAIDSITEVIVETGIVEVHTKATQIRITKGEKIMVNSRGEISPKMLQQDNLYNYYRTKEFVCDNTPLNNLVQTLNEAYNVNIVLADESKGMLLITATFKNESLQTILDVVAATLNLTVEQTAGNILLK